MLDVLTGISVCFAVAGLSIVAGGYLYMSIRVLFSAGGWDGSRSFFSAVLGRCRPQGGISPLLYGLSNFGLLIMVCGTLLTAFLVGIASGMAPYHGPQMEASAKDALMVILDFYF